MYRFYYAESGWHVVQLEANCKATVYDPEDNEASVCDLGRLMSDQDAQDLIDDIREQAEIEDERTLQKSSL